MSALVEASFKVILAHKILHFHMGILIIILPIQYNLKLHSPHMRMWYLIAHKKFPSANDFYNTGTVETQIVWINLQEEAYLIMVPLTPPLHM